MASVHRIYYSDASNISDSPEGDVDLIITSPPYPMIKMWDEHFRKQNPGIGVALDENNGRQAFELMHQELDKVWLAASRLLRKGGVLCVNIGDATRKVGSDFQLFTNHGRILSRCQELGFQNLPNIVWRKQTNAPNKFMGSGMLPPGAYVTLEHEYIMVFRKGGKREFKSEEEKERRRESAIFWEERNSWFSDVWYDLKGISQKMAGINLRQRSGAFPLDLAYRLINMFSIKDDVVLDPFLGTGTTTIAAMIAERNSLGYEIDENFKAIIDAKIPNVVGWGNEVIFNRLNNHVEFVEQRLDEGKTFKHANNHYGFPVISAQEQSILIKNLQTATQSGEGVFRVTYDNSPQDNFYQPQDTGLSDKLLERRKVFMSEDSQDQYSLFDD